MKVVFLPEVEDYLFDVSEVLYKKEFWGFKKGATTYVTNLVQDIKETLSLKTKKHALIYFFRSGINMFYSVFRKNKSTQRYVSFSIYQEKDAMIYLFRYISNKHIIAQYL